MWISYINYTTPSNMQLGLQLCISSHVNTDINSYDCNKYDPLEGGFGNIKFRSINLQTYTYEYMCISAYRSVYQFAHVFQVCIIWSTQINEVVSKFDKYLMFVINVIIHCEKWYLTQEKCIMAIIADVHIRLLLQIAPCHMFYCYIMFMLI